MSLFLKNQIRYWGAVPLASSLWVFLQIFVSLCQILDILFILIQVDILKKFDKEKLESLQREGYTVVVPKKLQFSLILQNFLSSKDEGLALLGCLLHFFWYYFCFMQKYDAGFICFLKKNSHSGYWFFEYVCILASCEILNSFCKLKWANWHWIFLKDDDVAYISLYFIAYVACTCVHSWSESWLQCTILSTSCLLKNVI